MSHSVDFIGVGAARSGTTWIANVLRAHPGICVSEPKEVRYFNRHVLPLGKDRGKRNSNFDNGLDWYRNRFKHASSTQITGEISPIYLYDAVAPTRIRQAVPEVRLFACLRHPADRAYSHYWLHRGAGLLGSLSFEEALEREPIYLAMSQYGTQLKRYFTIFDREQIHVLVFEELIRHSASSLGELFHFLGVTREVDIDASQVALNRPAMVRSRRLKKFAFRMNEILVNAGLSATVETLRRYGGHALLARINRQPLPYQPMQADMRAALTRRLASEIELVEELLGRKLDDWRT